MKIRLFWVLFFMTSGLSNAQNTFMMGSERVHGYSAVYHGFHIYQPLVAPQVGNSCGYHVVFNAQGFLQCLQGLNFDFMNAEARENLFGTSQAPWRRFVQEKDSSYAFGELVEADVLDQMVQRFFTGIGSNFAVFDNAQNFLGKRNAHFNSLSPQQKQKNLDTFFTEVQAYIMANTPSFYVFFINTANAFQGEVQPPDAHWVMVMFYKDINGVHTYYVADSTNQNVTRSPFVTVLIDRIESPVHSDAGSSSSSSVTERRVPVLKLSSKKEHSGMPQTDPLHLEDQIFKHVLENSKKEADALRMLEQKQLENLQRQMKEEQKREADRELQEALRLSVLSFGSQNFLGVSYEEKQLRNALELSSKEAIDRLVVQEEQDLAHALKLSLQMGTPYYDSGTKKVINDELTQGELIALVAAQRSFVGGASSTETEEQKRRRLVREAAEKRLGKKQ